MTRLYTLVANSNKMSIKKLCHLVPVFLEVDVEKINKKKIAGYEQNGRYTFVFSDNRFSFFLPDDFSDFEFNNLRVSLESLFLSMDCLNVKEYIYKKEVVNC